MDHGKSRGKVFAGTKGRYINFVYKIKKKLLYCTRELDSVLAIYLSKTPIRY